MMCPVEATTTPPLRRKLTAIVAADVVGYSKLVGNDEEGTLTLFRQYSDVIAGIVSSHGGRIFNTAGDAIMAEFSSPVEAVRASLAIQREVERQDEGIAKHRRIHFRIGIHLGDVIVDHDNLEGDGVNVAARLQSQADPGGILISGDVYRQVQGKLDAAFESLGRRRLKNISAPLPVYRVLPKSRSWLQRLLHRANDHRTLAVTTGAVLALVAAVFLVSSPSAIWNTIAKTIGGLPEEPSIAILPLKALGSGSQEDYLSDGLTMDITGELSRFKNLFVIASNSSFAYKDKPVEAQAVGRALGVRYLLQGTLQKEGSRVRISAQLVDAPSGRQIWSDRYDSQGEDIFAIQDDIIETVVARLAIQVDTAERERIMQNPTDNAEAYDHYLRGRQLFDLYTREGNASAKEAFSRAIELDPNFARAYSWAGYTDLEDYKQGWSDNTDSAVRLATQAVTLGPDDYYTHWTLASVYMELKDMVGASREYNRARELNANDPDLLAERADMLSFQGDTAGAIADIERAKRLNPNFPEWYQWSLALAYFQDRNYEETINLLTALSDLPNEAYLMLAISRAQTGKPIPRDEIMENLRSKDPDWTPEHLDRMPFAKEEDQEHWMTGLAMIGVR
ncbi:adenylate/guanylate cyclase domain-containing protein [Rhizobiaceae bacterium n13]|uniref:Adenylate/guanylate cyclase domain-containing protein n=1 Tax=Ferirhizobium litorale TaxID=2927786 RepID=A0AAE3U1S9_9HYPH|nr:adenylate/guanylate cyclase domain-containing protein [Fererhizobium litorale]MDI7860473.1 adenylate/guanylate cyclase domain-containing protein [Fererhizobium litorale]MDI7920608.1 adenylate/guanylate cyclase domain-containing protein [Fererhizobium litorale]